MSTHVSIAIACDEPGCTAQLTWSAVNEGGLNASGAARSASQRYGWAASVQSAKCPRHRRPVRTHEFVPGHAHDTCYRKVGGGHCYRRKEDPRHAV